MKKINTLLCCMALTIYGALIGTHYTDPPSQTAMAATTIDLNRIPYDLRPVRTLTDTIYVHDSIPVCKYVTKYRYKEVKIPYRDTVDIVVRCMFNGDPITHISCANVDTTLCQK